MSEYEVSQRKAQASGAIVRVDEDGRNAKESESCGGIEKVGWLFHLHRSCLHLCDCET